MELFFAASLIHFDEDTHVQQFNYRVNADRSQFAVFPFGPNGKDDNGATWGDIEGKQTDDMGMHSKEWLIAEECCG